MLLPLCKNQSPIRPSLEKKPSLAVHTLVKFALHLAHYCRQWCQRPRHAHLQAAFKYRTAFICASKPSPILRHQLPTIHGKGTKRWQYKADFNKEDLCVVFGFVWRTLLQVWNISDVLGIISWGHARWVAHLQPLFYFCNIHVKFNFIRLSF